MKPSLPRISIFSCIRQDHMGLRGAGLDFPLPRAVQRMRRGVSCRPQFDYNVLLNLA